MNVVSNLPHSENVNLNRISSLCMAISDLPLEESLRLSMTIADMLLETWQAKIVRELIPNSFPREVNQVLDDLNYLHRDFSNFRESLYRQGVIK